MNPRNWVPLLIVVGMVWVLAPLASADVDGDCTIIIAEQDLADHSATDPDGAFRIDDADQLVTYDLRLPPETVRYRVILDAGVRSVTLLDDSVEPDPRPLNVTGNFSLESYAWVGSGLYKIRAEAMAEDGSQVCDAEAMVKFQVGKVLTATMIGASIAVAGGGIGLGASVLHSLREAKEKLDAVKDFKQHLQLTLQAFQKR